MEMETTILKTYNPNETYPFILTKKSSGYGIPNIGEIFRVEDESIDKVKSIIIPGDIQRDIVCMWEMGGLSNDKGIASIIATPLCEPASQVKRFVHKPRPASRQAMIPIYKDCLVAFGSYNCGTIRVLVYRVSDIFMHSEYPTNALISLRLIGKKVRSWQTSDSSVNEILSTVYQDVEAFERLSDVMEYKFDFRNACRAIFASPFIYLPRKYRIKNTEMFERYDISSNYEVTMEQKEFNSLTALTDATIERCWNITKEPGWVPIRQIINQEDETTVKVYNIVHSRYGWSDNVEDETYKPRMYTATLNVEDDIIFPLDKNTCSRVADVNDLLQRLKSGPIDTWMKYIGN